LKVSAGRLKLNVKHSLKAPKEKKEGKENQRNEDVSETSKENVGWKQDDPQRVKLGITDGEQW